VAGRGMSRADAAWFSMDQPANPMVINAVLWLDAPIDPGRLRDVLRERIVERFPRFRQRVVESGPVRPLTPPRWEDDPGFDMDLHVHHLGLPGDGDRAALQTVIGDLMATPLDPDKPLWHVYLFDGYGEGCGVLVRIHHCIADGIALARLMMTITDGGATLATAPDPAPAAPAPLAALTAPLKAARAAVEVARRPLEVFEHADALARLTLAPRDGRSVLKGDLGKVQRVAWSDPFPLADVKRIGRREGATVNDVLVGVASGALGRYLRDRGQTVRGVRAMVPFNLRALDEPLPRDLGNRFGLVLLPLPVDVEDPHERIAAVRERMQEIKGSREPAVAYGVLGAVGSAPNAVEKRLIDFFGTKTSLVMTNVPGPRERVTLAGAPVRGVLVWAPASGGIGTSMSIFSYAGEVTLGLMTHAAQVPDPDRIVDAFAAELRALTPARRFTRAEVPLPVG
jgi:diacylglycerol O-acyltransferase / wax synthase